MSTYKKQLYLFLFVSLLIVLSSFTVLFLNFRKQLSLQNEIQNIQANLIQSDSLTTNLLEFESDKRGFQLTRNPDYLKNIKTIKANIIINIANLKRHMIADVDAKIVLQIDSLTKVRMVNLDNGITEFTTKGIAAAINLMEQKDNKEIHHLLDQKLDLFENHLLQQSKKNTAEINSKSNHNLLGLLILLLISILLIFASVKWSRRTQQRVIKSQNSFKEAQRIGKIGSWEWDFATNKLTWSQEQFRLFGETRKKTPLTYEDYLHHLSKKDQEINRIHVKKALEGQGNYTAELEISRKDGTALTVCETGTVLFDKDNNPKGIFGTTQDITERKKAELSLHKSQESYRRIVETAQEGIWMLDENNYTVFVNKKMCEMLEYSREEMMGKQNYYFKDEEGKMKARKDIEKRKSGKTETHTSSFIAKSGKVVWTSVSTNPIFDDGGNYIGTLGMFTDITERKRTDEELVRAQKKFQAIFDNTADGIYQSTYDGKFLMANNSMARIFGYDSPDELIRSISDIGLQVYANPLERKKMADLILKNGHVENHELQVLTKNKNPIWVSLNIRAVRDENNDISYFEGTLEEITERKKAEVQLQNLSNRLQLAVRATNLGIWDWDIVNMNTVWDEEMYRIYDINPLAQVTLSEAWEAAVHPDDLARVNEELQMAIRGEKEYDTEFRVIWKDKTIHHVNGNALVLRDQAGDALRMIGTNNDITERKNAEEKILELNRSLDQFANITAHDLQEPIRMVSGFLGLLEKKYNAVLDEQAISYIYRARDGADRMSILIKDLLEFSRSGNKRAKMEQVDLALVLDLVDKDLSIVMADTGTSLHIPTSLPVIKGTQSALYRLFLNLVSNGIKFRKKDTAPVITMTVKELPGFWAFTLQDNGIGIPEKDQPKLFQAFQRLHRRDEYPGTGLGLVTCKKIVEIHGGKIWISSEPGKETAFHFTISKMN